MRRVRDCSIKINLMVPTDCRPTIRASVKLEWSSRMSDTFYGGRYLRDAGLADANEQPVSLVRIVVLVAVALPVFGGFYYALLDYLLFG
jgi:hypothetical protein